MIKYDGTSLLDAKQFYRIEKAIFPLIFEMEKGGSNALQNRTIAILSSTPIVKTRLSLETAMRNLGGEVIADEEFEYIGEGQQLEDQIIALGRSGVDVIAMSHHVDGMIARAAAVSTVPIINVSEGNPVQGLCDAFTMRKELGRLGSMSVPEATHIAIVGALPEDKAARTLVYLLGKLWFIVLYFVLPENAKMDPGIARYLAGKGVKYFELRDLNDVKVDVIYESGRDMIFNRNGHTPSDNTVAVNMAVLMMALSPDF